MSLFRQMALLAVVSACSFNAYALKDWVGPQRALVILVEWSDLPNRHPRTEVSDVFFKENAFSLREYFLENSQGAFDLTGDVLDWKKSKLSWSNVDGCNPGQISREAWNMFKNDVDIANYDSDKNGKIDHLFVMHSGRIASDRVGPLCVFGSHPAADNTAVFQSEGVGAIGGSIPIGFYIHEAGHSLFHLPDLYADHFNGRYGIGMWGMMGLGCWGVNNEITQASLFSQPSHFEPLSKVEIGWVRPAIVTKAQKNVRLRPVETTGDLVQIQVGSNDNYYFEYRTDAGFSKGQKGQGLLIWHNFDLIQADGRDDLNHGNRLGRRPLPPNQENFGDASDPFPGSLNVTAYTDPQGRLRISNIRQTAEYVEFDVDHVHRSPFNLLEYLNTLPRFDGVERL